MKEAVKLDRLDCEMIAFLDIKECGIDVAMDYIRNKGIEIPIYDKFVVENEDQYAEGFDEGNIEATADKNRK